MNDNITTAPFKHKDIAWVQSLYLSNSSIIEYLKQKPDEHNLGNNFIKEFEEYNKKLKQTIDDYFITYPDRISLCIL